jgi:hypothetical protein
MEMLLMIKMQHWSISTILEIFILLTIIDEEIELITPFPHHPTTPGLKFLELF